VHPLLQELAKDQEIVEIEGENVGECLWNLDKKIPGMAENLFDRNGKLLKHIEIFVNGKTAFPNELTTVVTDGDEISLLILLAGG
jgi:molybdopterin converting factor small subunit